MRDLGAADFKRVEDIIESKHLLLVYVKPQGDQRAEYVLAPTFGWGVPGWPDEIHGLHAGDIEELVSILASVAEKAPRRESVVFAYSKMLRDEGVAERYVPVPASDCRKIFDLVAQRGIQVTLVDD